MKRLLSRCAALTAACLMLTLVGCGSGSKTGSSYYNASAAMTEESAEQYFYDSSSPMELPMELEEMKNLSTGTTAGGADSIVSDAPKTDRKIIYTADVDMESTDYSTAQAALMTAVEDAGGYLQSSDMGGSAERQSRWSNYTVRVPVGSYRSFLSAAGNAASITYQSESAADITSNYIDVEARLSALENQRDRLNALAEKAETTADLLEIESQLSDVQYQIENFTRQLRSMDDQVSYSTVNISLREVAILTPVSHTFGDRVGSALASGWADFAEFVQDAAVAVVYLSPVLLLFAVVITGVLLLNRQLKKRRAAKHAAALAAAQAAQAAQQPPQQ